MTDPQNSNQDNNGMGRIMLSMAFILALAMLTWFFRDVLDKQHNPNQQIKNSLNNDGIPEVVLQQNRQGHYYATGLINNQPVNFLLDTGATDVAVPAELAKKLNLKPGPEIHASTANGNIIARMTKIDRIDLGAISLKNVRATILPSMGEDNEILLGMSFLKNLEMIQRGNKLILRPYYDQQ